ncbi:unnamed protein product [Prorocentrum cordatum]|uniref:Ion transport domain-containing protein n=1 Tax=Prorocentrum cordatum TaxID=2364126 RepID=A0ABN9YDG5_9DINO|nr:unnamed protein product [Polarella glacialis]
MAVPPQMPATVSMTIMVRTPPARVQAENKLGHQPGYQQRYQLGYQPYYQLVYQLGHPLGYQPEYQPGHQWDYQYQPGRQVPKIVSIEAQERIEEVPFTLQQERAVEVEQVQVVDAFTEVVKPQVQLVDKPVPRVITEPLERAVEVHQAPLLEEQPVPVPQVMTVEALREQPYENIQQAVKQVPRVSMEYRERLVEMRQELRQASAPGGAVLHGLAGAVVDREAEGWCGQYPKWMLIYQDDSIFLQWWDCGAVCLLVVITLTAPFETAFFDRDPVLDGWFVFKTCVDILFFIDMCMQFFIVQKDENGRLVTEPCAIARAYMRCWFWIDFASIIPIDAYSIATGYKQRPGMSGLKAVKIARLLRLVRLLRLAKIQRISSRWHTSLGISNAVLSMMKSLAVLLIVIHWIACIWGFTAMQQPCGGGGWLSSMKGEVPGEGCYRDQWDVYLLSLYWAVMTLTSIGYGDIVPLNTSEYAICTVCMIFMAALWAYVIGAMCSIVATMHPQEIRFRQDVDGLNEFMEDFDMPAHMRKKMRRFFYESREVHRHRIEKNVIDQLSPSLQGEVLLHLHKKWIKGVWYFSHSDDSFVVAASRLVQMCAFAPDEEVYQERTLFIVRRGLCARGSNTPFGLEIHEQVRLHIRRSSTKEESSKNGGRR